MLAKRLLRGANLLSEDEQKTKKSSLRTVNRSINDIRKPTGHQFCVDQRITRESTRRVQEEIKRQKKATDMNMEIDQNEKVVNFVPDPAPLQSKLFTVANDDCRPRSIGQKTTPNRQQKKAFNEPQFTVSVPTVSFNPSMKLSRTESHPTKSKDCQFTIASTKKSPGKDIPEHDRPSRISSLRTSPSLSPATSERSRRQPMFTITSEPVFTISSKLSNPTFQISK